MTRSDQPGSPSPGRDPAEWVAEHGDALFRFAVLRVRERDQAEELVQETFLAALRNRTTYAGRSAERTWLIGILRNKIVDALRRRQRSANDASLDTAAEPYFDDGFWRRRPKRWTTPEGSAQERELRAALHHCLSEVPSPQREALCLRELDGVESGEVCQILGVTATNLWTLIHRAKLRLRECLQRRWFDHAEA